MIILDQILVCSADILIYQEKIHTNKAKHAQTHTDTHMAFISGFVYSYISNDKELESDLQSEGEMAKTSLISWWPTFSIVDLAESTQAGVAVKGIW